MKKSPGAGVKMKKKMTKEQMHLAIIKKKECDSKALKIVEQLLEPKVDPAWLMKNLKYINKCHMEDVIEERAISKLCGYVLCQKRLTVIIKQQYHISLKTKKVFDVTKRKNFCSSSCFGASNYLLEQMLISPLWLRDKEKIPTFRIYSQDKQIPNFHHGEVVDITLVESCLKDEAKDQQQIENISKQNVAMADKDQSYEKECSGSIEDFVLQTIQKINKKNKEELDKVKSKINSEEHVLKDVEANQTHSVNNDLIITNSSLIPIEMKTTSIDKQPATQIICAEEVKDNFRNNENEQTSDIIQQYNFPIKLTECRGDSVLIKANINSKENSDSEDLKKPVTLLSCDKLFENNINENLTAIRNQNFLKIKKEKIVQPKILPSHVKINKEKSQKRKESKKKNIDHKLSVNVNLAAKVEESFNEWITNETIDFLFGNESIKLKAFEKIETQDKYSILCRKLNQLQFEDENEDIKIVKEKTALKPAPHFAILQEEGQKLNVKIHAFYQGKNAIEEFRNSTNNESNLDSFTFLPLTDAHAPLILRRKIFLDRLDQILPDLLRTLSGNNEIYARASCNYTSLRCTAVKALVHTFSLTAKNIIFKTAEWTLVGLVIIKMLSLIDPWLATLLIMKQANLYISMILTSYKLDPHYLNLLVASYNPNMNPR